MSQQCSKCKATLRPGARFCGGCGATSADAPVAQPAREEARALVCSHCGAASRDPYASACQYCGTHFLASAPAPVHNAPASSPSGAAAAAEGARISDWERPAHLFVKRVRERDILSSLFATRWRVPHGSFAAVLGEGRVERIVEPGGVIDGNWWDALRTALGGRASVGDVVLLDLRPVPVSFTLEHRRPGRGEIVQFEAVVEVWLPRDDTARLGHFLEQCLHAQDSLDTKAFHDLLRPDMTVAVDRQMATWPAEGPADVEAARVALEDALINATESRFGIDVRLRLQQAGRGFVLEQTLGGESRALAASVCTHCSRTVEGGKPFCGGCGTRVSTPSPTSAPAASAAEACAKCGAIFREGARFCGGCASPRPATAPASSPSGKALLAPLRTRDGRDVEVDLAVRGAAASGAAVAPKLFQLLRNRIEAVLLQVDYAALSEPPGLVDRARNAVMGMIDDTSDDLRRAHTRGIMGTLQARIEEGVREGLVALGVDNLRVTLVDIREVGSAWLLAGRAALDRARAEQTLGREWLAVDAQGAALQDAIRDQALEAQTHEWARADRRAELEAARRVATNARDTAVQTEQIAAATKVAVATQVANFTQAQTAAQHTSVLAATARVEETKTVQHGIEVNSLRKTDVRTNRIEDANTDRTIKSTQVRGEADDLAYTTRLQDQAKIDKLTALAKLDAEIEAREEARRKAEREHELERQRLAEQARIQQLEAHRGLSADQILAMNTAGNAEAAAKAFAAKSDGDRIRETYVERDRLRDEDQARIRAEREALDTRQSQMDAMIQQTLQATMTMAQSAMAAQGQRAQETAALYAQSADRAERVATASMHAISGAVARRPVTPVGAPAPGPRHCRRCSQPVTERFCDHCGASQS